MDLQPLPQQLLASVQAAPKPGLALLFTLVEQGMVSVLDPVDDRGTTLMNALINGALYGTHAQWPRKEELLASLLSADLAFKWLSLSDKQAFAGRDEKGQWLVQSLLKKIDAERPVNKPTSSRHMGNPPRKGNAWQPENLDAWLARVLPTLPEDAWKELGSHWLAYGLSHGLTATIDKTWGRASILGADLSGEPALFSARRGSSWDRFLQEGGDPSSIVGNAPLWEKMLMSVCKRAPASEDSFNGRFEAWFLKSAPLDSRMRPHLKNLAFRRAMSASKTSPPHWMKIFQAGGPEILFQKSRKQELPCWQVAALAHPKTIMFDLLEATPDVMQHIPRQEFDLVRFMALVAPLNTTKAPTEIGALLDHIDQHGWPSGVPIVSLFAGLSLPKPLRLQLVQRAAPNPDAWWGPAEDRDQLARKLALMIPENAKTPEILDTWMDMVSIGGNASPWVSVGLGLVGALRNRPDALEAIPQKDVQIILSDEGGEKLLLDMVKKIAPRNRAVYAAWLESMVLSATCVQSSAPKRSRCRL